MSDDAAVGSAALAPAARLGPGDHACWFFRSREEHRQGVTAFVRRGVESGARILYLADAIPLETVMADLEGAGLGPDRLSASGQLVPLSLSDGYLEDDTFDPVRQVNRYRALVEEAEADGYRALWITGEGTWQIRGDVAGPEDAQRYERMTEEFLVGADNVLALCQYDASAVSADSAAWLRSVHNLEVSTEVRMLDRRTPGFGVTPTGTGLAVSGSVDLGTWTAFRGALHRMLEGSAGDAVLDVTDLAFIDGHGLGIIGRAARTMQPGRTLVVRGASHHLIRVAEIMGLHRLPSVTIEGGVR